MTTAPISLQGHRPDLFTGQRGAILRTLLERKGQWIPSFELSRIALQYGARVKECREAGFLIENRTERVGRKVHGSFRLVAEPGESPALFGAAGATQ
jgi:hypothetical protein